MGVIDAHIEGLKLLFDVIPLVVVKVTAQIVTRECNPEATNKDGCVGNFVFHAEK